MDGLVAASVEVESEVDGARKVEVDVEINSIDSGIDSQIDGAIVDAHIRAGIGDGAEIEADVGNDVERSAEIEPRVGADVRGAAKVRADIQTDIDRRRTDVETGIEPYLDGKLDAAAAVPALGAQPWMLLASQTKMGLLP